MSLRLSHIRHRFGAVEAVADASLEVAAGEVVCLFGPSGCGKTTLLRVVAGLETLQEGSVELDGRVLCAPGVRGAPETQPVGFVFQDYVLFPHLTALENVAFGIGEPSAKTRRARAKAELEAVGLAGLEARYPHELSGGQQQRVALARAFARRPRAMLLDEPFASIDGVLRRQLRDEMRRILKENGAATILVTHDPDEALALGDRIAVMKEGRILETAAPDALFANPATPEGAGVFAGAQQLDGVKEDGRIRTSFGEFAAEEAPAGRIIAVALPGSLRLIPDPRGSATAISCRFAGPGWIVELGAGAAKRLRVPSDAAVGAGERFSLAFDPALIKVFSSS